MISSTQPITQPDIVIAIHEKTPSNTLGQKISSFVRALFSRLHSFFLTSIEATRSFFGRIFVIKTEKKPPDNITIVHEKIDVIFDLNVNETDAVGLMLKVPELKRFLKGPSYWAELIS